MVFDLEFNEFYYGKDDFDQKSLMKGLDLVTSRLYAERKTDDLIWTSHRNDLRMDAKLVSDSYMHKS